MTNTINTMIGAFIAALIGFCTGLLAMLTQGDITSLSDIQTLPLVVLGIGALLSFLKDFQALATRRVLSTITKTPEVYRENP